MNEPAVRTDTIDEAVSRSVWRYAKATRAHVVVDAADYFLHMQDVFLSARERIMMIGWDFDTRVRLGDARGRAPKPGRKLHPDRLGAFIIWLCDRNPGLEVRVLKWNFGAFKFVLRGTMIFDLYRWLMHKRIKLRFDGAHPIGCSHHQKIVVVDDAFAVCGGIDMTSKRWDTREHLANDPRRVGPGSKPYQPWHDLTMMVEGEAAAALGDLGRARWKLAGGAQVDRCAPVEKSPWPSALKAEFEDVEIGIARTRAAYGECGEVREIEALFIEHIRRAKSFIYAESQYFASRKVAEALAQRMAEPNAPEVVLINPESAEGWLEQAAMDGARVQLTHAINDRDANKRFRIFIPYDSAGTAIYVHSKTMIVDDRILRVGSANLNNRSMGLDSECDLFIDADRPGNDHVECAIRRLRVALLAEHCGLSEAEVEAELARDPSMIALIERAVMPGKCLKPFELRPLSDTEKTVADNALLDPERPEEMFEPFSARRGLFRRGGLLRRPR